MKMKDLQITINETLKKLEEAQELLGSVFQTVMEEPTSVVEQEPASDQTKEPFTQEEPKEYRTDLVCTCDQKKTVYDNRSKIKSGEYSSGSPHFKCSNNKDCGLKTPSGFPKGWWLNSKDLPTGWISTAEESKADDQTTDVSEAPF
jgi:hypothetical protein